MGFSEWWTFNMKGKQFAKNNGNSFVDMCSLSTTFILTLTVKELTTPLLAIIFFVFHSIFPYIPINVNNYLNP